MKRAVLVAVVLAAIAISSSSVTAQSSCGFQLGFLAIHNQIPTEAGDCLENETHNDVNGDGLQHTTKGLLVWRKADNFTAFTDGWRTWVNGPLGLQRRLNSERFQWEALARLKGVEVTFPQAGVDQPVRLQDGKYQSPDGRVSAGLVEETVVTGDLNGDNTPDALAVTYVSTGGSGTFVYLVAFMDHDGRLAQAGAELLGDRVKVNHVTLAAGAVKLDPIVPGPGDPMCCPTQATVRSIAVVNLIGAAGPAMVSPSDVALNPRELATTWRADSVPATPYDTSQPPGPKGLPAHIEVVFGAGEQRQPGEPIMYIIPVGAYRKMWSDAGNAGVANALPQIANRVQMSNAPGRVAALPFEELAGANDLAVQIGRVAPSSQPVADSATRSGYRFVGRWAQDANPVTNRNLRYVYQGFTNDGRYLVTFFYPVTTDKLPPIEAVSPEEMNRLTNDYQSYMAERMTYLNSLVSGDFSPSLATLDALVASLTIQGMPASGLQDKTWQWVSGPEQPGSKTIVTIDRPERYRVTYTSGGRVEFTADCNRGSLSYELRQGGLVGGLLVGQQGPDTLAECGPESHSRGFVASLWAAQNYRIEPGGNRMSLILPAGGGTLEFVAAP